MMSKNQGQRVLVIGLDGASFRVLDPLVEAGYMPNLASLLAQGVRRELTSTLPTNSVAAWTSYQTGKNPGKHGVFSFIDHIYDSFVGRVPVNTSLVADRFFWEIAAQAGRRVAVMNMPMTYPVRPTEAVVVAGLMTPRSRGVVGHPEETVAQMLQAVPDYRLDVMWDTYGARRDALLADLVSTVAARTRAALWLYEREPFDLFQVVYTVTDRLQHALWNALMATISAALEGKASPSPLAEQLLGLFQEIDAGIGAVVGVAGPETTVLIISDHGFGPTSRQFVANQWLAQHGYLHFSSTGRMFSQLLARLVATPRVRRWARQTVAPTARRALALALAQEVDWTKTCAYSRLKGENSGLSINLCGREPHGTVPASEYEARRDELFEAISGAADPETGQLLFKHVYRREDLFSGPYANQAPDLVLEPASEVSVAFHREGSLYGPTVSEGNHTREGVLIASGPPVDGPLALEAASILDVAPTILHILGLPVSIDMDGSVLTDLFTPEYQDQHPVRSVVEEMEGVEDGGDRTPAYTPKEQAEVEDRLRGLGYL